MTSVWTPKAFEPLIERLSAMGAPARLPKLGEDTDLYVAQVLGWMLDVSQPNKNALAKSYWNRGQKMGAATDPAVMIDHEAEKLQRGEHIRIDTPKSHITEQSGRSYRIEGAVQDGKVYRPGEPLPPVATDEDN